MSVFTPVTSHQMQQLLNPLGDQLCHYEPASEGIENSNFFVTVKTRHGNSAKRVVTLLEQQDKKTAARFHQLLQQLAQQRLPVPAPLCPLQECQGKPVMVAPCFDGVHPKTPTPAQATAAGRFLAQLHQSPLDWQADKGADERARLRELAQCIPLLPADWQPTATQLLADWQATAQADGTCLIHGDLFRDNTLFEGDHLSGVLDFFHACYDLPVYDIAVVLNDWALFEDTGRNNELEAAVLAGYKSAATLPTPHLLALAKAVAALRFWLSRLQAAALAPTQHQGRGSKPPSEFAMKTALRWRELSDSPR